MSENQTNFDGVKNLRAKNFQRRSSIQKIIYICNQSYQVFPYVFFWFQDFQTSLFADVRKLILLVKSLIALRLAVYLSIGLVCVELLYCLAAGLSLVLPSGSVYFFFSCVGILSLLALQIFDVSLGLRRKLRGCFFVKKKKLE